MEIEIIKYHNNDNTIEFGYYLNSFLSQIKTLHWYTKNLNFHKLLDDIHNDISKLFDEFQEELILMSETETFPNLNYQDSNILKKQNNQISYDNYSFDFYKKLVCELKSTLLSIEFENFLTNKNSGLNNKKEEIISFLNKSLYLLNMIDFK
jgi:hypothetical protein